MSSNDASGLNQAGQVPAPAAAPPESKPYPRRWLGLAAVAITVFMSTLDSFVVDTGLPTMAKEFHVGPNEIKWIILAYLLPVTSFLVAAGRLADVLGRKKIQLTGLVVFLTGSMLCAFSANSQSLALTRVVQGLGAAMVQAPVIAIVSQLFSASERGRALGTIGVIGPLGAVTGPSLGGFIITWLGWRAIFFINLPVGIFSFLLGLYALPNDKGQNTRFDWWGSLAFAVSAFSLMLALSGGGTAGKVSLPWLVVTVAGLLLFVLIERRAASPTLPLGLMGHPPFFNAILGLLAIATAAGMNNFLIPFFLARMLGQSAQTIGLTVLFLPLFMAMTAPIAGWLSDKVSPRLPGILGGLLLGIGLLSLTRLSADWSVADVVFREAFMGVGLGMFTTPNQVAIVEATPPAYWGSASSVGNTMRAMGFALGPALSALIWLTAQQAAASRLGVSADSTAALASGMRTAYAVASVVAFVSIINACFFAKTKRRPGMAAPHPPAPRSVQEGESL